MAGVTERLLASGLPELLEALLAACDNAVACRLSRVSRAWALAAEVGLRAACDRHSWRLPRRPRLQRAAGTLGAALPWRTCFVARSCRACMLAAGDFAVRGTDGGAPRFYLCRACAKSPRVVTRLQRGGTTLDVAGLSGKLLYTRSESKFCADVARLSKESIDNASGSRADAVRMLHRRPR